MSFLLNKMASLLATLVVAGIVLFCSSAAQAHTNHGAGAADTFVKQVVTDISDSTAAPDGVDQSASAVAADGKVDSLRVGGSSCCGTGVSNCMAASVGTSAGPMSVPPFGTTHDRAREPGALAGVVLDGMIRPPIALV